MGRSFAPVAVHQERYLLEGEETDAKRQQQPVHRPVGASQGVQVLNEKVIVFVIPYQAQVEDEADPGHKLPPPPAAGGDHPDAAEVVDKYGQDDQGQVGRIKPAVEEK
ncbi:MAG: hypothetical protein BWY71_01397 [Planctomycetes bacterium ADurb.Bin412]|nr:MAG: hypothetical protein BWY71_01397 [Planctomycetes bacterium ADurb.Bin412]